MRRTLSTFYDVGLEGRFVMVQPVDQECKVELRVVLNWTEELKRLVPAA